MKSALIIIVILLATLTIGCESFKNSLAANGGFWSSYAGDYIVVSQSGGTIMDVYKLKNVFVESEGGSDGWRFKDQSGNMVFLGGDVKIIRVYHKGTFNAYQEYHMEVEAKTYRELYGDIVY